jgi:hypothetical protein
MLAVFIFILAYRKAPDFLYPDSRRPLQHVFTTTRHREVSAFFGLFYRYSELGESNTIFCLIFITGEPTLPQGSLLSSVIVCRNNDEPTMYNLKSTRTLVYQNFSAKILPKIIIRKL